MSNSETESKPDVLLWGARAMATDLNTTPRKIFYLLKKGMIKCAEKRGGIYIASRRKLRKEYGLDDGVAS